MLKVTGLTKIYGDRVACDNISFVANDNRVYGFLGPNGAGKSTTMNMITGYICPTEGEILVNDINMISSPLKAKKKIGYLPEIPPLYPDMTVYEYLSFAFDLKGLKSSCLKDDEIDRVMELTNIMDVEDRLIKTLSKGYKQRVGLSQALLGDPEVIILDEPSVGLDPKQIVEIRNVIRELGKNHLVILSTHILSEVNEVCDEVIIISNGKICAQDTIKNLEEKYNHAQRFTLVLKGNASGIEKILEKEEDIDEIRIVEETSKHCVLDITAKLTKDIREKVSTICTENGYIVLELSVKYVTLEEVYLQLTGEAYNDSDI